MTKPKSWPWTPRPVVNAWPAPRSLCRLIFGAGDARLSWTPLARNDVGVTVQLPQDYATIELKASGDFDGAALVLQGSSDGASFAPLCAPLRSPRSERINARPAYLRPVVEGGGPDVLIVVSLVAQRA